MGAVAAASAVVLGLAAPAPAGVADDRFDQIDGPLGAFVVRPGAFGVDASAASADVASLLDEVDGARAFSFVEQLAFPRTADGPEQARQDARDLIAAELVDAGYEVQTEPVVLERTGIDSPNLFAELPDTLPEVGLGPVALVAAGLLVGVGTRLGNGCTSGHGICGLARLSPRSFVAVGTFFATAVATVFVMRHVL